LINADLLVGEPTCTPDMLAVAGASSVAAS
jgi:hypothetical protein